MVFTWSVLLCYLAVAFCGDAARRLGKKDPGEVILDEFAVIPLVFLGWRAGYVAGLPEWAAPLGRCATLRPHRPPPLPSCPFLDSLPLRSA